MYKNHIGIAKLFRYDPDTNEYFYHHKAKLTFGPEEIREDEWVCVSKETFDFLRRSAWAEDKQQNRASRCLKSDGTRCWENCKNCEHSRSGLPLSLSQLMETDGLLPENPFDLEEYEEYQALVAALYQAISSLETSDQKITLMWSNGLSEREIAKLIGMSQRGVGYRIGRILKKLQQELKDFR